jgi:hypothetical protein
MNPDRKEILSLPVLPARLRPAEAAESALLFVTLGYVVV